MEDVLDVYQLEYDAARPVVCFDETSKQLVDHVRTPLPARRGAARRVDDEYVRQGTANIFAAIEPLTGQALVEVTERRTSVDTARFLKRLSDEVYAAATKIVLVMDNLSTHSIACLYEAFPPAEARRIARRFEIHHTPKHGSWLDVAEIFLSTMSVQCLDQRVAGLQSLRAVVDAWLSSRKGGRVRWQFRAEDARIKLHRLYPSLP
jgi:hypothetical protein